VSDIDAAGGWHLSPTEWESVDRACDRFEEAWQTDAPPTLKDFVQDLDTPVGKVMLCELLKVELAYRIRRGSQPTVEEYQAIFPAHAHLIAVVFEQVATQPVPVPDHGDSATAPAATNSPLARSTRLPAHDIADNSGGARPRIPGYETLSELGRGAMGVVYKAWQQRAKRHVALKVIRDGFLAGPEHRRRFKIEAEAAAQFQHPNLIRIYEVDEHQGVMYFSMELGEGGSLDKKLAGRPLPAREAAELARTLAGAVQYAHEKKIIHRDLKPGNIVLTADGRPLVTDFGLAKRLDSDSAPTLSNAVLGTAAYMPPEQARGDAKNVGPLADVYSLGAILYELLSGQPPFHAATLEAILQLVVHQEPPPLTRTRRDVPAELEAICFKCLEKEPGLRYTSASALAEDLRRFLAGEPPSVKPLTEWDRQARWARQAGFEILDVLGGSRHFGIVYKARQVRLNRTVILKTVATRTYPNPLETARFRREGQTLAQLQHPNIVQVYDLGEHAGQAYMATEYVEGGTLAEKLLETPWPPRQAVALITTLARAVHHAHQRGIVHHALRPFNILLTADNVPKITNFGLDWLLEAEPRTTGPRQPIPHHVTSYMAPEQTTGPSGGMGAAADIYALGAILYELLTGRVPIAGEDLPEFLRRVRLEPALAPSHWRADLPRSMDAICLKCLCKVPSERYPSAEALAEALQRFLTGEQQNTAEVELIPGYTFEEELGRGGMGIVHKARQINLDRFVALKVFHATVPPPTLEHVRAANRAMARLQDPNLVQVYDCGERDGLLYVAEEWVEGITLEQQCAGSPQPPRQTAGLVQTLARATHFAHEHGIIHCNLKPRAVLVSQAGIPKIGSFEAAKLLDQQDLEGRVTIVVTPTYMAPEQAAGDAQQIGPATDVYALGNILYEMLTGRSPFQSDRLGELLDQIRFHAPVPPRQLLPSVPQNLETICLNCLKKQPSDRYPSAALLDEELGRFLAGKPLLAASKATTASASARTIRADTALRNEKSPSEARPWAWSRLVRWLTRRPPSG
jgi:serine/threonine protein kinase